MAQQYTKQQLANLAHDMAIKYNLPRPDMFVRQIIAESNLNPNAVSPAKAAGIAQFMPDTGLQYGLRPEDRFDPVKSLDAAARYMRDLTKQFKGDQYHATGAYNAGAAGYSRNLAKNQARSGTASISIPETRDYMAKIWNSNTDVDKAARIHGVTIPTATSAQKPAMYGDTVPSNINTSDGGKFMSMSLPNNIDQVVMGASDDKYANLLDKANQQSALTILQEGKYADSLNAANTQAGSLATQAQNVVDNYKVKDSVTLNDLNARAQDMADVNARNDARYAGTIFDGTIGGTLSNFWDRLAGGVRDQADYDRAKNRAMDAAGLLNSRNQAANLGNSAINQASAVNSNAAAVAERGLAYEASPLAARSQLDLMQRQLAQQAAQNTNSNAIAQAQLGLQARTVGVQEQQLGHAISQDALTTPVRLAQQQEAIAASQARTAQTRTAMEQEYKFGDAARGLGLNQVPPMATMLAKDPELYNAITNVAATGAFASNIVDSLAAARRFPNAISPETGALFSKIANTATSNQQQIQQYLKANGVTAASPPDLVRKTTEAAIRTIAQNRMLALRDSGTGGGLSNPWRMTAAETAKFIYAPQMDAVHNIGKVRDLFTANPAPSDAAIIRVLAEGVPKADLVNSITKFFSTIAKGNETARSFTILGLPPQNGYMSGKYDLTNPANAAIVANLSLRQVPKGIFGTLLTDIGIGKPPAGVDAAGNLYDQTEHLGASK